MQTHAPLLLLLLLLVAAVAPALVSSSDKAKAEESLGDLILRGISVLIGQAYEPEESVPASFKEYALSDTSNDDVFGLTTQEFILRSGYNYENHQVVSDDGYITTMVRIINPLADRSQLKGPPVMLMHGGITDQKLPVWCSSIQHHPEKFPRTPADGPITSWNRSIGFVLANNGYDVWLVGTRGSNSQNQGHVTLNEDGKLFQEPASGWNNGSAQTGRESKPTVGNLLDRISYWDYSMDEVSQLEIPRQIDKVLEVTGAHNVSIMLLSFSTTMGIMMVAEQPEYQRKLHSTVVKMPIISNKGTNSLVSAAQRLFKLLPSRLGTIIVTEILLSQALRDFVSSVSSTYQKRYLILKAIDLVIAGASSRYLTLLEPAVFTNIFMPTSFRVIKQFSQIVTAARIQKYDYGPLGNKRLYGSLAPRPYDLSQVDLGNWLAISAGLDALAPPSSAAQFVRISKTPPVEHIVLENYNHLDALAAFDIDSRINLPVLNFMDRFHLPSPPPLALDRASYPHESQENTISHRPAHLDDSKGKSKFERTPDELPNIRSILMGHAKRNLIEPLQLPPTSNQRLEQ